VTDKFSEIYVDELKRDNGLSKISIGEDKFGDLLKIMDSSSVMEDLVCFEGGCLDSDKTSFNKVTSDEGIILKESDQLSDRNLILEGHIQTNYEDHFVVSPPKVDLCSPGNLPS